MVSKLRIIWKRRLFNTTRYLEFLPRFYILISTVANGLPSVIRFMIGCTPLYLGYAMLGTVLFGGRSANFGSVPTRCVADDTHARLRFDLHVCCAYGR